MCVMYISTCSNTKYELHAQTSGFTWFIRPRQSNRTDCLPKMIGLSPSGISIKISDQYIIFNIATEVLPVYI